MKFFQIAKRISLFLLVNFLIIATINIIVMLVFPKGIPHGYGSLAVLCAIMGTGGAFISLLISRWMAKVMMGVEVIDPNTNDPDERSLLSMVENLTRTAGIPMPEVGVYHSPEINAFATGPSKNQALVAVSSGLLRNMRRGQVEGVLAHEVSHIANGDMVTMTLLQGVINAFVMFLAYILAFAVSQAMSSRDDEGRRGGGNSFFLQFILVQLFQFVFSILGYMVVAAFSRWREYRADAGGARLAGRQNMVDALKGLKSLQEQRVRNDEEEVQPQGQAQPAFQAFMISGKPNGFMLLFSTHPPLEERIARLENPTLG